MPGSGTLVDEVAAILVGVTLTPYTPADAVLRAAAMRALEGGNDPLQLQPAPAGPLTVATDGSAHHGRIGWGWVAADGRHGCGSAVLHERESARRALPLVAELRAISAAISALPDQRLVIRTDSQDAIALIADWATGGHRLPAGYDGSHFRARAKGGLVPVREQVRREAHRLDLCWVKGHAGDPLNECADSLAKLARRARGWLGVRAAGRRGPCCVGCRCLHEPRAAREGSLKQYVEEVP